jgi:hypothetical protein
MLRVTFSCACVVVATGRAHYECWVLTTINFVNLHLIPKHSPFLIYWQGLILPSTCTLLSLLPLSPLTALPGTFLFVAIYSTLPNLPLLGVNQIMNAPLLGIKGAGCSPGTLVYAYT